MMPIFSVTRNNILNYCIMIRGDKQDEEGMYTDMNTKEPNKSL